MAHPPRPGWLPRIDPARCTGCGWCVAACEPRTLSLEAVRWKKTATLHDPARCTGCSDCAIVCPFRAISMHRAAGAPGAA
ncbi:ATP-binding protein [Xenophilus azovorans]|uniref:ATP-binding protein n=1 Tax=Xenophilus TaxID=151754 RepID=UPI000A077858|nr:4Fe-4S binding protein [Xenophilus azovorans]